MERVSLLSKQMLPRSSKGQLGPCLSWAHDQKWWPWEISDGRWFLSSASIKSGHVFRQSGKAEVQGPFCFSSSRAWFSAWRMAGTQRVGMSGWRGPETLPSLSGEGTTPPQPPLRPEHRKPEETNGDIKSSIQEMTGSLASQDKSRLNQHLHLSDTKGEKKNFFP